MSRLPDFPETTFAEEAEADRVATILNAGDDQGWRYTVAPRGSRFVINVLTASGEPIGTL